MKVSQMQQAGDPVSYRKIWALAWPASVAASITPLLGTIDVWALGQSSRPLDIAAIGLAGVIFSLTYWTFGFIRMSVAGLTAQAAGAGEYDELRQILLRGLLLGGVIGFVILLLQWPLGRIAFYLLGFQSGASDSTFEAARSYFAIRIWGAPFALATYACLGWLTARGRTDYLMLTGIMIAGINMALDIIFVLVFGWGASGVALGTLIAESLGFFIAFVFVVLILKRDMGEGVQHSMLSLLLHNLVWEKIGSKDEVRRTLNVNRDIFIRTLLLAFSFTWFVQRGGVFGDVTLAANQILLQLFLFTGLAIDGTAIAAETMVGRAIGDPDREQGFLNYQRIFRRGFVLAFGAALLFAILYAFWGAHILGVLVKEKVIIDAALNYWVWIIFSPLAVMVCFQLDGIFIGATRSGEMRDSMIMSVVMFVIFALIFSRFWGNHGLWFAFMIFFFVRAMTLMLFLPRIRNMFFAEMKKPSPSV